MNNPTLDSTLSLRIRELLFTTRVVNCCDRAGICLLGQLVRKKETELAKWRNMGRKSLAKTQAVLASKGVSLGSSAPIGPLESQAMRNCPLSILLSYAVDRKMTEFSWLIDSLASSVPTVVVLENMPEQEALRCITRARVKNTLLRDSADNYFYRLHRALEEMKTAINPHH